MAQPNDVSNSEVISLLFIIAPQFETDDPAKLASYNALLDQLRCFYNPRVWCCGAALGLANLLAHYLSLANNPNLGIVANMSEGDLSIGYATSATEDFFNLTAYGKAFAMMRGQIRAGPLVATGCSRVPGTLAWGAFYGTPFGPCC